MHGPLWILHKDHHKREKGKFFQRNDFFFIIFGAPAIFLIYKGFCNGVEDPRLWIGFGIATYGLAYIFVHDIFVHRRIRIKFLNRITSPYFRALRKAHLIHHKYIERYPGENYGFLFVPIKYIKEELKKNKKSK
jgi:beta-carotene 3-hydroxylase